MHIPIPGAKAGTTPAAPDSPSTPRTMESSPTRDCFILLSLLLLSGNGYVAGHIFAGYPHRAGGFHVLDRTRRRTLHPADAEQGTAFGLLLRAGGCDRRHRLCHGGLFRHRIRARLHRTEPVAAENHRRRVRRRGRPLYLFPEPRGADTPQQVRQGQLWRDFLSIFLFTIANPAISLVFVGLFAMFGISNDAGYINGVAMLVGVLAGAADGGSCLRSC